MTPITGKDGAVSLGGSAVNGTVKSWKLKTTSKNVDASGMGNDWEVLKHIRSGYTVDIEFMPFDQASWDLGASLVGTEAVFALKRKASDTNPYATGTALVVDHDLDFSDENPGMVRITVRGSTGVAPTIDATPAT